MSKKNIAVLSGGYSSEAIVAEKSANTILNHLNYEKFNVFLVVITKKSWFVRTTSDEFPIDKNDFSATINNEKIIFDCVYITIHGTPGEDGKIQGYFDMLGIPYTTANQLGSTLTFNKWTTNQVLLNNGFTCAKSILLYHINQYTDNEIIEKVGLPCFVKPNDGGSSFGVSKVSKKEDLGDALKKAFSEGSQTIIESFVKGTEVTCGVFKYRHEVYALPLTEVVSHNEYFDYDAKYNGFSDEITPARVSDELTTKIQQTVINIYKLLNLSGIARIDFIISNNIPHIIEVNTTPGMTDESLIPQQIACDGKYTLGQVLEMMIEEAIDKKQVTLNIL